MCKGSLSSQGVEVAVSNFLHLHVLATSAIQLGQSGCVEKAGKHGRRPLGRKEGHILLLISLSSRAFVLIFI